eukprot:CAMPEP_0181180708 /NCGR_PEP_ID=MMETSP1096-20121128/6945_1 /TAXON_ID=156174 ORGANISM="Chrysochromulina ericina, Strain CCMP281" /NCGR_SAMPLE_ID=MMETSP1096 /ASSEMBLY_ACC=CAM_ASM_000453 /LENGTH=118 /DNA_ID=CAMNT_0023269157 /DNA_START=449 /DNA_END=805 /DNA_ORIENTATION=+
MGSPPPIPITSAHGLCPQPRSCLPDGSRDPSLDDVPSKWIHGWIPDPKRPPAGSRNDPRSADQPKELSELLREKFVRSENDSLARNRSAQARTYAAVQCAYAIGLYHGNETMPRRVVL